MEHQWHLFVVSFSFLSGGKTNNMNNEGFLNGLADLMEKYKVERLMIKPHDWAGVNLGSDPVIEIMNKNEQWTTVLIAKDLVEKTESGTSTRIEVSQSEIRALANES